MTCDGVHPRRVIYICLSHPPIAEDVGLEPAPVDAVKGVGGIAIEPGHPVDLAGTEHDLAVHGGDVHADILVLALKGFFEWLADGVGGGHAVEIACIV